MKPYLIFSAIFVVLAFLTTVFTLQFFLLVITMIELYFFICAYSLYVNFVTQSCGLGDVVYQNPGAYGYTQAYENEDYGEDQENYQQSVHQSYGNLNNQKQEGYGNFDGQQQQQPQQPQYYGQ
jgi:hypothetical protein